MWEKITYSGKSCNSYLYFSFDGDQFDPKVVSHELQIEPTSVRIKGNPVPKSTSWMYRFDAGDSPDLESILERLVSIFESKAQEITRLKKKYDLSTRLQFVIDIDINPNVSTPYFGLNKRAIHFLKETETIVDFDLYKADTLGLLDDR
ncbi:MAG: DUF4279 domain-containing protein [Lewinella sp.]|uniref:DUF4279 domain-containing protein n=1 Tax=Lewinella sp. TaxID=2004506 RepID=UPI003D6ADE6A